MGMYEDVVETHRLQRQMQGTGEYRPSQTEHGGRGRQSKATLRKLNKTQEKRQSKASTHTQTS